MKTQKRRSLSKKRSFEKRRATHRNAKKNNTKNKHQYFLVKYSQKGGAITCDIQFGKGSYGKVYKCIDEGNIIGVKKVLIPPRVKDARYDANSKEFKSEIHIMQKLHGKYNDYILQYKTYESIEGQPDMLPGRQLYYYSEYCDLGSLDNYVKSGNYTKEQNPNILKHILQGFCYLFDESIIHSDIHTENILVQQSGDKIIYKIADFGKGFILAESGSLDLKVLPSGSVLSYIYFSTYFRDLHGWFMLLLNLYHSRAECDEYWNGFYSPDIILYPINIGSDMEIKLIKLFNELQFELIKHSYLGKDNKIHREILNNRNHYELKGNCVTLIQDEPIASVYVDDELPQLPPRSPIAANNAPINIDIQHDRAIYEPIYTRIKQLLEIS